MGQQHWEFPLDDCSGYPELKSCSCESCSFILVGHINTGVDVCYVFDFFSLSFSVIKL